MLMRMVRILLLSCAVTVAGAVFVPQSANAGLFCHHRACHGAGLFGIRGRVRARIARRRALRAQYGGILPGLRAGVRARANACAYGVCN